MHAYVPVHILSSYFLVPEDVFVTFFAKLKENVNPDDISAQLYAKCLISSYEKEDIDLRTLAPHVRMDKLLAAVQKAIKIDPSNYEKFLEILDKEKKYSNLVKEMRGMVVFTLILWHCCLLYTLYVQVQVQPLPIYVPGHQANSIVQDRMCICPYHGPTVDHNVLFAHFFRWTLYCPLPISC